MIALQPLNVGDTPILRSGWCMRRVTALIGPLRVSLRGRALVRTSRQEPGRDSCSDKRAGARTPMVVGLIQENLLVKEWTVNTAIERLSSHTPLPGDSRTARKKPPHPAVRTVLQAPMFNANRWSRSPPRHARWIGKTR